MRMLGVLVVVLGVALATRDYAADWAWLVFIAGGVLYLVGAAAEAGGGR